MPGLASAKVDIERELVEDNLIFFSWGKSILYSKEGVNDGLHTVRIVAQKRRPLDEDKAMR